MSVVRSVQKHPCYQQVGDTCGYWCTRIAAEILMGRKFKGDELKKFKEYKAMCSRDGVTLMNSAIRFAKFFPDMCVNIDALDTDRATVEEIQKALDIPGTVCLLNMQNMDFKGDEFVENSKNHYGHNVCCVSYDDEYFYIQDSNKYKNSCKKRLKKALVAKGAKAFEGADLDTMLKLNKKIFHITEVMCVYLGKPREQKRTAPRRSGRKRRVNFTLSSNC
jgi:hypothetical protein